MAIRERDKLDADKVRDIVEDCLNVTDDAREESQADLYFSRISHYTETREELFPIEYRGQFDKTKRVIRKTEADILQQDVMCEYVASDGADQEATEAMNKMYRYDLKSLTSRECFANVVSDLVAGGIAAWRFVTEDESEGDIEGGEKIVRREHISDPNMRVYWSHDRNIFVIRTPFTKSKLEDFLEENGIKEDAENIDSFYTREYSNYLFYNSGCTTKDVTNLAEVYQRIKCRTKYYPYQDQETGKLVLLSAKEHKDYQDMEVESPELDNLLYLGGDRTKIEHKIYKYVMAGDKVLLGPKLMSYNVMPVMLAFLRHSIVNDKELWESAIRELVDPQIALDISMSAGIQSFANQHDRKPIIYNEQITGHEDVWDNRNDYQYLVKNAFGPNGEDLTRLQTEYTPAPELPPSVIQLTELLGNHIASSTNEMDGNRYQDAESNKSASADALVMQTASDIDAESFVHFEAWKLGLHRDAHAYQSIKRATLDTQRVVAGMDMNDKESSIVVNEEVWDPELNADGKHNDMSKGTFKPSIKMTQAQTTLKEQYKRQLLGFYQSIADGTNPQLQNVIVNLWASMQEGSFAKPLAEFARKQLIETGVIEPETEEEKQYAKEIADSANQKTPEQQLQEQMALNEVMQNAAEIEHRKAQTIKEISAAEKIAAEISEMQVESERKTTSLDLQDASNVQAMLDKQFEQRQQIEQMKFEQQQQVAQQQQNMLNNNQSGTA